jgi:hypothetical protein
LRGREKIIAAGIVIGLSVYLTLPSGRALNYETCEPKGALTWVSEQIYGRSYWKEALAEARRSADAWPRIAQQRRQMDLDVQARMEEFRKKERELTAKYPGTGPGPAEQAADVLRDRADQIEINAETDREIAIMNRNEQDALHCVAIITNKLASSD